MTSNAPGAPRWVHTLRRARTFRTPHLPGFALPFWAGLGEQILDTRSGLLRSAPPILLSVAGAPLLFRRARAEAVLITVFSAAQLAIFAKYSDWMASNFGHRFLLTVVALGAVPAAALVAWLLDGLANKVSTGPRSNTSG